MKKVFIKILAAFLAAISVFCLVSCGNDGNSSSSGSGEKVTASVYMPDGAPALSMAKLMSEKQDGVTFNVVTAADAIRKFVTGENPEADLCVLPLNAASKLLGTGETYTMLGTVTHGNLYLLSNDATTFESGTDLGRLAGKTVGTIQIDNVPGLTLKLLLGKNGVSYGKSTGEAIDSEKANLVPIEPAAIGTLGYDYYLAAEPAASAKVKASKNSDKPLHIVADLQKLYGGANGYPQAVLVVKNTFLEANGAWVKSFIADVKDAATWLTAETTEIETIVNAVKSCLTEGLTPSFNQNNLTKDVIGHCGVYFTGAQEGKAEVNAFLAEMIGVSADAAKTVADKFFYSE